MTDVTDLTFKGASVLVAHMRCSCGAEIPARSHSYNERENCPSEITIQQLHTAKENNIEVASMLR